jgi:ferric-dicitrate binding protein FerR (iron transport regulator)
VVADDSHAHVIANVDGLQAALDAKAPLASPALTGTPTAPTAISGTNTTQVATTAFVQQAIVDFGPGDMLAATYDTDADGKVDAAEVADAAPWAGITDKPTSFPPSTHSHAISQVNGLQTALDAKAALASPALTGTPTAPTAVTGTNTTQIATTAFVAAAIGALIDAAPGAMDTLNELAAALGDDPNFASTVTNALAGKLSAASNLSDLPNKATARSNLGLGSIATQAANSVVITGGSIDGIALDGGTF